MRNLGTMARVSLGVLTLRQHGRRHRGDAWRYEATVESSAGTNMSALQEYDGGTLSDMDLK